MPYKEVPALGWLLCPPLSPLRVREGREVLVGREPACELALFHSSVSRVHCRFRCQAGRLFVEDAGSAGGTLVNGSPLEAPTELQHGDVIIVGRFEIEYLPADAHIDSGVRQTIVGTRHAIHYLQDEPLAETAQMLEVHGRTAVLAVLAQGRRGVVHVIEGKPVHAAFGDLEGDEALLEMLQLAEGRLKLSYEDPPAHRVRTVHSTFIGLLLEAGRRSDEGQLERSGALEESHVDDTAVVEVELPEDIDAQPIDLTAELAPDSDPRHRTDAFTIALPLPETTLPENTATPAARRSTIVALRAPQLNAGPGGGGSETLDVPEQRERPARAPNTRPRGFEPGRAIGAYMIERTIGVGSMGRVYLVRHRRTRARYALKSVAANRATGALDRFQREAEAQARVGVHPNVVRIHETFIERGRQYVVTDWAPFGSLGQRLVQRTRLEEEEAVHLARDLARGLAHIHAHGVVHRDVKPDNVLFGSDGLAKLADFGLASLEGAAPLTITGDVMGTPLYMAPEQARGQRIDAAADVYALGVILYEALTGTTPFVGDTPLIVLRNVIEQRPPRVSDSLPEVDRRLDDLVDRALAKRPTQRPPAAELAGQLDLILSTPRPARPSNLLPALIGVALASVALLGVALGAVTQRSEQPPAAPTAEATASSSQAPTSPVAAASASSAPQELFTWTDGERRVIELSLTLESQTTGRVGDQVTTNNMNVSQRLLLDCQVRRPAGRHDLWLEGRVTRLVTEWALWGWRDLRHGYDSLDDSAEHPLAAVIGQTIHVLIDPQTGQVREVHGASSLQQALYASLRHEDSLQDLTSAYLERRVTLLSDQRLGAVLSALLNLRATTANVLPTRDEFDLLGQRDFSGGDRQRPRPEPLRVPTTLTTGSEGRVESEGQARQVTEVEDTPGPGWLGGEMRYTQTTTQVRRLKGVARLGSGGVEVGVLNETITTDREGAANDGSHTWTEATTQTARVEIEVR